MISDLLRVTIFVNCYTPLVPATFNHAKQDREKKRETDRESERERERERERSNDFTMRDIQHIETNFDTYSGIQIKTKRSF